MSSQEIEFLKQNTKALEIGSKAFNMLSEIRKDLEGHKQQLIDGGTSRSSVTIESINQIIIKTYLPDGK